MICHAVKAWCNTIPEHCLQYCQIMLWLGSRQLVHARENSAEPCENFFGFESIFALKFFLSSQFIFGFRNLIWVEKIVVPSWQNY
jgi:hypothetical protein